MAEAANQDDVPEPQQPLPEYQRLLITGVFLATLIAIAVSAGLSAYSFVLAPPPQLPPPIKRISPWIEWQHRYYGDTQVPRILIWTGSPSGNCDVSRVEMPAGNTTCNFTDGHDDSRSPSLLPCSVTHDRSLLMESDAIVFHADLVNVSDLPRKRASNQLWVFWARTHPAALAPLDDVLEEATSRVEGTGTPSSLPMQLSRIFNWTMAHREDAVVHIAHKSFVAEFPSTADMLSSIFNQSRRLAMAKRLDAAWIASTCELDKFKEAHQRSSRLKDLMDALGDVHDLVGMTQTDLQILPDCGASLCKSPTDCVAKIAEKFKFIVATSTTACFESVEDLVYEAFKHDIVPVVIASPNFKLTFPPKSVVTTTDKPGHLHGILSALITDPVIYEAYFDWKRKFRVTTLENELCPLCQAMQEQPKRQVPPALDYREWWERRVRCRAEELFNVDTFRKDATPLP